MSKLRLYTFCNFYLSSIQQGIQTSHIVSELFVTCREHESQTYDSMHKMLWDWAQNHKTVIVCNGGTSKDIVEAYNMLMDGNITYPMAYFNEEPGAIDTYGTAVTGFGIILPEKVYGAEVDPEGDWMYDAPDPKWWAGDSLEAKICEYVTSRGLAR